MREIREVIFRGKRTDNGEWITDSETYIRDGDGIWLSDENLNVVTVIPETVGQYTGLTDKNGVRIFEGDIVSLTKWNGLVYKVVYDNCRYELHNDNKTCCFVLSIYKSKDIIVIGNIHDNPEILKGGGDNG